MTKRPMLTKPTQSNSPKVARKLGKNSRAPQSATRSLKKSGNKGRYERAAQGDAPPADEVRALERAYQQATRERKELGEQVYAAHLAQRGEI